MTRAEGGHGGGTVACAPSVLAMNAHIEPHNITSAEMSEQYISVAYESIKNAETPDEAEELLRSATLAADANRILKVGEELERRWAIVKLRAQRRWGELLGPAEPNGRRARVSGANPSSAEKFARSLARKVAEVPDDDFDTYVLTEVNPSRSGLLRRFFPARNGTPRKPEAAPGEDMIKACFEGIRRNKTQAEIARKLGVKHDSLPLAKAYAVAEDRYTHRLAGTNWNRKTPTKRMRELEAMRNGDYAMLRDWQQRFAQMCAILETIELDGYGPENTNVWIISDVYDDLISLGEWYDRTISMTQGWLGDISVREKIKKIRDTAGRTPEEAETANRLADRLEEKLTRLKVTSGA